MKNYPFLPGDLTLSRGSSADYASLARFHYLPRRPATWSDVWVIRFAGHPVGRPAGQGVGLSPGKVVALAVLSYPSPSCLARRRALRIRGSRTDEMRLVNRNIRCISRVIVHPQFRALGLSSELVRVVCAKCNTRYVEAIARMGIAHPFFERGGMRRINRGEEREDAYYLFDRDGRSLQSEGGR